MLVGRLIVERQGGLTKIRGSASVTTAKKQPVTVASFVLKRDN
jgi:hypothetical protein